MAGHENIRAAIENAGSDACWTVPGDVEWGQGNGRIVTAPQPGVHYAITMDVIKSDEALAVLGEVSPGADTELLSRRQGAGEVADIRTARSYGAAPASLAGLGYSAMGGPNITDAQAV